jgi:hypothetical protein
MSPSLILRNPEEFKRFPEGKSQNVNVNFLYIYLFLVNVIFWAKKKTNKKNVNFIYIDSHGELIRIYTILSRTPFTTIPAWNSAGRKSSRFQLFTRYRQIIFRFDNMLDKSVKIDRIKYPTTTFAVLLISFCITVMKFLRLGVHMAL